MADYISREAALAAIHSEYVNQCERDGYGRSGVVPLAYGNCYEMVKNISAADVAPIVHGRWEYTPNETGEVYCSECGRRGHYQEYDFCPHCPAKMDL